MQAMTAGGQICGSALHVWPAAAARRPQRAHLGVGVGAGAAALMAVMCYALAV